MLIKLVTVGFAHASLLFFYLRYAIVILTGSAHDFLSLDELVEFLTEKFNEMQNQMIKKEEMLEKLFKLTSKAISDYETKTAELRKQLHKERDDQVNCR